jgi:hypothetical protein
MDEEEVTDRRRAPVEGLAAARQARSAILEVAARLATLHGRATSSPLGPPLLVRRRHTRSFAPSATILKRRSAMPVQTLS